MNIIKLRIEDKHMEKKKLFINHRYFYFLTELFVGIALMGVEMSASRFVAVYFSSSQIVWTIIIGVIMIAMAAGNYWGGRQADKKPSYLRLYFELLFAGVWIVLIPFLGRFVIAGISVLFALFITKGLVIWAALFSCLFLFVPPLLMLGKVTPSLIKYSLGEKVSGRVIGLLEALNTVGSIIGTFLPTFLTIPFIGTSNSFVLFGSMIAAIALVYVITHYVDFFKNRQKQSAEVAENGEEVEKEKLGKKQRKMMVFSAIFSFFWIFGLVISSNVSPIFWKDDTTIIETDSMYNYLKVNKEGKTTYFSTNVLFGIQSCINDDYSLTGMYYDKLLISPYLVKENPKILVLGNGTGTYATMMKDYLHWECDITAVEIDQKIIDLSYKYFKMNKDVHVVCDDGRNFIARDKNTYDIILVDAYSSISAPFHMTTTEFFTLVRDHLNDNGIMMMNVNMYSEKPGSVNHALCDTSYGVFKNLYAYYDGSGSGMEVYASKNRKRDLIQEIDDVEVLNPDLQYVFNNLSSRLKPYKDTGIRLYDDTADVEMRSIRALDDIIQIELNYYRQILKEEGLSGLIKRLFS